MKEALIEIFERDLLKLKEEISLYKDFKNLWKIQKSISNSAGNLTLHLIGNLNHFIGATLGNTGYIRQREKEFSDKNISVTTLNKEIDAAILTIKATLTSLPAESLENNFPLEKHGSIIKTSFMLLHLSSHLSYHLGQINYHRRLLDQ